MGGWEFVLRDLVKTRFIDGVSVNDYLDCQIQSIDGKSVARLSVARWKRFSFLKVKEVFHPYRRQGTRTEQVHIDQAGIHRKSLAQPNLNPR
jgi:hypothetical protein